MKIQYPPGQYDATESRNNGLFLSSNYSKPDIIAEMQQKIFDLENELHRQKVAAENGGRLLKLMWGHSFDSESLY